MDWRIAELRARIQYAISPPSQAVFIPQGDNITAATPAPTIPTSTPAVTQLPSPVLESNTQSTPEPSLTPIATATALPERIVLSGVQHEYQTWNNCGPANLLMALSYWGWQGTQQEIAEFTKPNPRDKNVMPYEMASFVADKTDFEVIVRVGGDVQLIKSFLAAGFPVILEKGFEGEGVDSWMGHYVTVTGYDDITQEFIVQDSYINPDMIITYGQIESFWRAFNFTYLVIYPPDRSGDIMSILGSQADVRVNFQRALEIASTEIYALSGRDQFFSWFNRGTNLVALQDYSGAAASFDEAFLSYALLTEEERPWRMMWYQTGPYWAYFYTGRFYDVIDLATTTLDAMSEPVLEESYYWRGRALETTGDIDSAINDYRYSLQVHPGFQPSLDRLINLGVNE